MSVETKPRRFEHTNRVFAKNMNSTELTEWANTMGKVGWELVSIIYHSDFYTMFFKREVIDE